MSINSQALPVPVKKHVSYPKLRMSNDGCVVLFSTPHCGTVVAHINPPSGNHKDPVGTYSGSWVPTGFVDFVGKVELENTYD